MSGVNGINNFIETLKAEKDILEDDSELNMDQ